MARKKKNETGGEGDEGGGPEAPQGENNAAAMLRLEKRIERVPITAEQAQARLQSAAAMVLEARSLRDEADDFKARAKNKKKASEAKHEEADQITVDAQNGTAAAEYPVLVERHPTRAMEMITWRGPLGVDLESLLQIDEVDQARLEKREQQGFTLVETRAMNPDEIEVAKREDFARANPQLPFEGAAPAGAATGTVLQFPAVAKKAEEAPTCPFVVKQHDDEIDDELCGEPGSKRRFGFCQEHYDKTGGKEGGQKRVKMLTRLSARREALAERERATQASDGESGDEAAAGGDEE